MTTKELNIEARERLLDQITLRMNAMNHCIINRLKYALDKAEFARNHSLSEPMEKVEDFLADASRLVCHGIKDLEEDVRRLNGLASNAKEIRKSEESDD